MERNATDTIKHFIIADTSEKQIFVKTFLYFFININLHLHISITGVYDSIYCIYLLTLYCVFIYTLMSWLYDDIYVVFKITLNNTLFTGIVYNFKLQYANF